MPLYGTTPDATTSTKGKIQLAGDLGGTAASPYIIGPLTNNLLINGNMDVWQRNTTATPNDDAYSGADRWNFLTETNGAWTVARDTDSPDGSTYSIKFSNVTLNNQCAIVQILENKDTIPLDDKYVSLSFYAKTNSTEIANLRAAILTWGSTADSVTSDVIGTWAQDGNNPTWATNWTLESTPANFALTSSWQQFKVEGVLIDTATVNNLAVIIWTDDGTIAANDDFFVSQVNLNLGTLATTYAPRPYAEELALCMRYYQKYTTPHMSGLTTGSTTAVSRLGMTLPVEMRIAPTCVFGAIPMFDGGATPTLSSIAASYHTTQVIQIDGTASGNFSAGARPVIAYVSGSATVTADAEM